MTSSEDVLSSREPFQSGNNFLIREFLTWVMGVLSIAKFPLPSSLK